ncbi:MAG: hypothetical protein ACRECQ_16505 [Burkholderiaceae bacterium]
MNRFVSASQRKPTSAAIDVLAFPPDEAELQRRQAKESERWLELERRARVALFFGAGMFLAWAADVGAAFEIRHAGGSAWFGVASVPIAVIVVLAHIVGRWTFERAARGRAEVARRYSDVTQREATPLLELAQKDSVIAQYLRCVGRQRRALRRIERIALYAWAEPAPVQPERQ